MEFYEPDELERVLRRAAPILGVDLRPDGAEEIAGRSRGTPRIANRLLRRVRDFAEVRADGAVTREVARAALAVYDVDELGLDRLDRAVLGALVRGVRRRAGRRVHAGRGGGRGTRYRRGGLRAVPGAGRDAGPDPAGPGGDGGGVGAPGVSRAARRPGGPARAVLTGGLADSPPTDVRGETTEIMESLGGLLFPLLILLLFIPIFLSGRKQRRQMQEQQQLQSALEVGDVVTTTSGLRGTVVDASYEDTVDLEIADGVVTTWLRAAVRERVLDASAADAPTSEIPPPRHESDAPGDGRRRRRRRRPGRPLGTVRGPTPVGATADAPRDANGTSRP